MSQHALIAPIREWLVDQALGDNDIVEMFEALCIQISSVGIPVTRARLLWPTLHPLFQAETVIWDKEQPAYLEQFEHQDNESDDWKASPLKFVIENGIGVFRRELSGANELVDFGLLKDLKEQGITDYLILATELGGMGNPGSNRASKPKGVLVTWATDRPGGFSADDLESLQKIHRRFAVACKSVIQKRIANNITKTYIGQRAGENVLEGLIRRGDGQTTSAVVWYSDLRDSTSLAETLQPDDYFSMLNDYFEATAEPVVANGGEVLDFIGDAVLGIFPYSRPSQLKGAAKAANLAIDQALARAGEANLDRESDGRIKFKFGIGVNVGDVMFGNIGIPSRLTFSVIGPTVNEVARIEQITKVVQQTALASRRFAEFNPERWQSIGEHKLAGVLEPAELFSFRQ